MNMVLVYFQGPAADPRGAEDRPGDAPGAAGGGAGRQRDARPARLPGRHPHRGAQRAHRQPQPRPRRAARRSRTPEQLGREEKQVRAPKARVLGVRNPPFVPFHNAV